MLQDIPDTLAKLRRLREVGLGISVDDFGTGYSSLSYLQRFPVTSLKIARDFVHVDESEPDSWELASAIVSMGRALHLEVVAEGVEHLYQLNRLRDLGCRYRPGLLPRPTVAGRRRSTRCWDARRRSRDGSGTARGPAYRSRHRPRCVRRAESAVAPRIRGRAGERRYVANGTRTGTFGPCRTGLSAATVLARGGDHARSPPRPAPANPSKGGDAKPGIFGKRSSRFHRPPGRQAPTTRKVAELVLELLRTHSRHAVVTASRAMRSPSWPSDDAGVRLERRLRGNTSPGSWSLARGVRASPSAGQAALAATTRAATTIPPATRTRWPTSTLRSAPMTGGLPAIPGRASTSRLIDTGCTPGRRVSMCAGKLIYGPDLSLESQAPNLAQPRHERPRHVHGGSHRRQRQRRRASRTRDRRPTCGMAPDARVVCVKVGRGRRRRGRHAGHRRDRLGGPAPASTTA